MFTIQLSLLWSTFFYWWANLPEEERKEWLLSLHIPERYFPLVALATIAIGRLVYQKSVSASVADETKESPRKEEKSSDPN
jgi:hypothetical protein